MSTLSGVERSGSATDHAYRWLKTQIIDAELAPNEHFLESELADRLGVSRTPVREACIRLESEGMVEIVPRRGVRIVPISPGDMADVYDLLATLESRAAELAAGRSLTEVDLRPMQEAVDDMASSLAEDDLDAWAAADAAFHRALVLASGNAHLAVTAMQFADLVQRARLVTLRLRPTPHGSVKDHKDLLDLIRVGDEREAYELHLQHRRRAAESLVELLDHHRLRGL